jgi:hypothetical protein
VIDYAAEKHQINTIFQEEFKKMDGEIPLELTKQMGRLARRPMII